MITTNNFTVNELERLCNQAGIFYKSYIPGDGVARYRLFTHPVDDYFQENGIITLLGIREAIIFIEGYTASLERIG